MSRFPLRVVLPLLLIVCASLPVAAREVRLQDANGESGTCPEAAAEAAAAAEAQGTPVRATTKRTAAQPKGKTPPAARGNDVSGGRAPRWHSFLPGMFR